jgi:hypothetical protein
VATSYSYSTLIISMDESFAIPAGAGTERCPNLNPQFVRWLDDWRPVKVETPKTDGKLNPYVAQQFAALSKSCYIRIVTVKL